MPLWDFPLPDSHAPIPDPPWRRPSSAASPPPARHHLLDLGVVYQLAGIRLANASLNLFDMPALHLQVRRHRLVEQISPVAIEGHGERVQSLNLVFVQSEADGLLVHITK